MSDLKKGTKISKNFEIDSRVLDLKEIIEAAGNSKSIYVTRWRRASSASFLISWPLRLAYAWMESGCFYTTKKIENE